MKTQLEIENKNGAIVITFPDSALQYIVEKTTHGRYGVVVNGPLSTFALDYNDDASPVTYASLDDAARAIARDRIKTKSVYAWLDNPKAGRAPISESGVDAIAELLASYMRTA